MKRILAFLLAAALIGCHALPVAAETTYTSGETVKIGGIKFKVPDGLTAEENDDGSIAIQFGEDSGVLVLAVDATGFKSDFMREYLFHTQQPETVKKLMEAESEELFCIEYQIQKNPVDFTVRSISSGLMLTVLGTFIHDGYSYTIIYNATSIKLDSNGALDRTAKASFDDNEMVLFENFLKSIKF